MLDYNIKETIEAYLEDDIESNDRFIYFKQYHSSKDLTIDLITQLLEDKAGCEVDSEPNEFEDGFVIRNEEAPIIFWSFSGDRWLLVFSSSLDRRVRERLSDLSNKCDWLLDVWVPSDEVSELYHTHSPKEGQVNIERKWDPYYIYQRTSDIPENLVQYYKNNINQFVQQEIEFNLKTPRWMVDRALEEGVQEDLLEKSEISKSKFTYSIQDNEIQQDGGVQTQPNSTVTVRNGGQIVHRSGNLSATYDMLDGLDSSQLLSEFKKVVPDVDYQKKQSGIVSPTSYTEGKVLKVIFKAKGYNEEANIKLSNLLTVGQADVDIHGVVKNRGDLWFFAESNMSYDQGEYEILFKGESNPPFSSKFQENASLYIRPVSGTPAGLLYIYHKLKEKFDSRTVYEICEEVPYEEVM
jgi:hypothetical protein